MKVSDALRFFKNKGLPEREALILISHVTKKPKEYFIAHDDVECSHEAIELLEKRLSGYPLQYIIGEVEFYGRKFYIEEGVLIPRWETEGLVEIAIDYIGKYGIKNVLEIGVGSGAILITIALETNITCYGTDIDRKALDVALKNASRFGVKCDMKLGKFAEPFEDIFDEIQMVISNPPYVREDAKLPKEVTYEPVHALFAGKDGLNFYKEFFKRYNLKGKIVIMEIGSDQADKLIELTNGIVLKDLAGKDRYLVINNLK
ncbi:MAG: peptide chain release factor N(5)-glutamine methyltransferase [Fervidobacterium sp.]